MEMNSGFTENWIYRRAITDGDCFTEWFHLDFSSIPSFLRAEPIELKRRRLCFE